MGELQNIFYYFKNESGDILSDDELIEAMKTVFDCKAQGSLEYLTGTALESLCRVIRGGEIEEDEEPQKEADDEERADNHRQLIATGPLTPLSWPRRLSCGCFSAGGCSPTPWGTAAANRNGA